MCNLIDQYLKNITLFVTCTTISYSLQNPFFLFLGTLVLFIWEKIVNIYVFC
jgi:hypothetical protein